jgi:hypothetical protein
MTVLWFIIWFVANNVGGHAPLLLDPVNGWTGTLLLALALDLAAAHATRAAPRAPASPQSRPDA